MANPRTIKIRYYRSRLANLLLGNESAKDVENRYKTIPYVIYEKHAHILDAFPQGEMIEFMKDLIWADRELREFTKGRQKKLKKTLSDEKITELNQ